MNKAVAKVHVQVIVETQFSFLKVFLMYLFAILKSPLVKCLVMSLANFLVSFFFF